MAQSHTSVDRWLEASVATIHSQLEALLTEEKRLRKILVSLQKLVNGTPVAAQKQRSSTRRRARGYKRVPAAQTKKLFVWDVLPTSASEAQSAEALAKRMLGKGWTTRSPHNARGVVYQALLAGIKAGKHGIRSRKEDRNTLWWKEGSK